MLRLIPLVFVSLHADKTSIMISAIDQHLYIGEQVDAKSPPSFISAVFWTALEPQFSPPSNLLFARLPLKENAKPNPIDLEMGIQWLARHLPRHHILVACRVGIDRSPSIIIAYLCCMQGLSFAEAYDLVSQKRPGTTPLPHLAALIEQIQTKNPILSSQTR